MLFPVYNKTIGVSSLQPIFGMGKGGVWGRTVSNPGEDDDGKIFTAAQLKTAAGASAEITGSCVKRVNLVPPSYYPSTALGLP